MTDFYWKQHDTSPSIRCALTDGSGSTPSGTLAGSVKFIMKATSASLPKVNASASIVDGTTWTVQYDPIAADTDTVGDFNAEWEVTFASGKKQTFPNPGYLSVQISADLDNA